MLFRSAARSGISGWALDTLDQYRGTGGIGGFLAGSFNPGAVRSVLSGLPFGAARPARGNVNRRINFQNQLEDDRVRLTLPIGDNYPIKLDNILKPLAPHNGILFPYTPQISFSNQADYETVQPTHTNYVTFAYKSSRVDNINLSGDFTAATPIEALYCLAVIHFFRTVTKMFYGQDPAAVLGSPPPILLLNGYGEHMFKDVPVAVGSAQMDLQKDVDMISTPINSPFKGKVPAKFSIALTLHPIYSRASISSAYSTTGFSQGGLNTKGFI